MYNTLICELFITTRLILLNKLLEDGNTLFKRNRFEEAAHRYSYALKRIPATNNNVTSSLVGGAKRRQLTLTVDDEVGGGGGESGGEDENSSSLDQADHESLFNQLRTHLLLNLSKCQRKMADWDGAVESATRYAIFTGFLAIDKR